MRFQLLPVFFDRLGICERLRKRIRYLVDRHLERFDIRCPLGLGYCFRDRR